MYICFVDACSFVCLFVGMYVILVMFILEKVTFTLVVNISSPGQRPSELMPLLGVRRRRCGQILKNLLL